MTVYVEIKGLSTPTTTNRYTREPQQDSHVEDNLEVTATASWALAGTLGTQARSLIVYNSGPNPVGIAFATAVATQTKFHVVPPGGQREIFSPTSKLVLVREL